VTVSGTYQVMLKITLTLTLTLTYTRPPMFDRLQRRNNSHFVKFFISPADCGVWTYPHFYTDERPCGTVQMVHVGCVCLCVDGPVCDGCLSAVRRTVLLTSASRRRRRQLSTRPALSQHQLAARRPTPP